MARALKYKQTTDPVLDFGQTMVAEVIDIKFTLELLLEAGFSERLEIKEPYQIFKLHGVR